MSFECFRERRSESSLLLSGTPVISHTHNIASPFTPPPPPQTYFIFSIITYIYYSTPKRVHCLTHNVKTNAGWHETQKLVI